MFSWFIDSKLGKYVRKKLFLLVPRSKYENDLLTEENGIYRNFEVNNNEEGISVEHRNC